MKKLLIIVSICLIVIICGVLTGLYIVGDKIIDESFDMMTIPTTPIESTVALNKDEEPSTGQQPAQLNQETIGADSNLNADTDISNTSPSSVTNNSDNKENQTSQKTISVEKMNEVKSKVTAPDKVSAAVMVMSRLSTDEINMLKGMLSGGLTAEEKAKAKAVAYSHFTSEEISEIKDMYKKYMNK